MTMTKESENSEELRWERKLRRYVAWSAILGVALFTIAFCGRVIYLAYAESYWKQVGSGHVAAMLGLPGAALAALALVLGLKAEAGPIKFKGLGFEFEGASGQVILWILCFLAITAAIKLLWPLG